MLPRPVARSGRPAQRRERLVDRAVVAPVVHDDLAAAGQVPGVADRVPVGVRGRQRELPVGQPEPLGQPRRHRDRVLGRQHRRDPAARAAGHGLDGRRGGVAHHRAGVAEAEVDVVDAVDAGEVRAGGALDEDREVAGPLDHPAHRDAARHVRRGLLGEGPGPRPGGGEGGAFAGVQLGQAGAVDGAHDRIMPCAGRTAEVMVRTSSHHGFRRCLEADSSETARDRRVVARAAAGGMIPAMPPSGYRGLSLWHDTIDDIEPRPALGHRPRGGRRRRRRRLHRPLDGIPPRHGGPDDPGGRHREGGRRLRRVRSQRWLVLGPLPRLAHADGRPRAAATRRCGCSTCCTTRSPTIGRIAAAEGIDCHFDQGGYLVRRAQPGPARTGPRGGRRPSRVGLRRGRPPAPRRPRGARRSPASAMPSAARSRPHCAAIHPARLVRGLADAVERRGVVDPRAHRRGRRAQPTRRHGARHRPSRARRPRDRGLHADRRRPAPGHRADLLAHDGDGAAAATPPGLRSAWRSARRSPTTGT